MNEAYSSVFVSISILFGTLIFSIGCAALHAELTEYVDANNDQFGVVIFGILAGLGLLILSIPAIVYIAIINALFLSGRDAWLWDNGGWGVFSFALPLIGIIIAMWAVPTLRFLPHALAAIKAAIFPSQEARRAKHEDQYSGGAYHKSAPDPFEGRMSNQAREEETERKNLAAELDEVIADLERKKHELRQRRRDRN